MHAPARLEIVHVSSIETTVNLLLETENLIKKLEKDKEELTRRLAESLGHPDRGSKTYTEGAYKFTVTSPVYLSANKAEVELYNLFLKQSPFKNVIQEKITLAVNAKIYNECMQYGDEREKELISKMVSAKPGKLSVKFDNSKEV